MKVNQRGLDLIKHFESLHDGDLTRIGLQPKMDPVGIWTVGYGHALYDSKGVFLKGEKNREAAYKQFPGLTELEAVELLADDLPVYEAMVYKMIQRRDLNDDQHSAIVSFCYNCGTHYRAGNKMVPFKIWSLVDGYTPDKAEAMREYWDTSVIKSGGRILPGLVRRRKAEAHLFLTGKLKLQW